MTLDINFEPDIKLHQIVIATHAVENLKMSSV